MISDTHLATLQAMGITLYTPRSHSIVFDEHGAEAGNVGNSIEHSSQELPKQARSHRSSTSSSHIDQIKSMLRGKSVNSVSSEIKNSVEAERNSTLAGEATSNSPIAAKQHSIHNAQRNKGNADNTMATPTLGSTNTPLRELVSAQWLNDFQLSLPEQYRQTVEVSELVNVASVLNGQLVLPMQLLVPVPQSQRLYSQILALYAVGENTNG